MKNDPLTRILLERNAALDQCDRLRKRIKRLKQSHLKAQESFVDDLRKIIQEKAKIKAENEQLQDRIDHLERLLRDASGVIYSYEHARASIENARLTGKHVQEWIANALPKNESES